VPRRHLAPKWCNCPGSVRVLRILGWRLARTRTNKKGGKSSAARKDSILFYNNGRSDSSFLWHWSKESSEGKASGSRAISLRADFLIRWGQPLLETDNRVRGYARRAFSFNRGAAVWDFRHCGGLSILLGYRAKLGAGPIMLFLVRTILFLVRTILMMDRFWAMHDPLMARMHMALFKENVALIGGALLISQFVAGPFSVDAWRTR
jgi:hypothetical protein